MPNRYRDWFRQAKKDLEHAKNSLENGDYEWACFASQQSVEKAIKAIYQKIGADAWGHSVNILLANLPDEMKPTDELIEIAKELDKYYIPPRYPNSYSVGAPFDYSKKRKV